MKEKDIAAEMAEQQLLGFNHASQGFSLLDLVDSMGLTLDELEYINSNHSTLSEEQFEEIREHL